MEAPERVATAIRDFVEEVDTGRVGVARRF